MTTFIFGPDDIDGSLGEDVWSLNALVGDLGRINDGCFPTREEVERAPLLENYRLGVREQPCLYGSLVRHPGHAARPFCTSELWVLAEPLGWARTLSRLYRLGQPALRRRRQ